MHPAFHQLPDFLVPLFSVSGVVILFLGVLGLLVYSVNVAVTGIRYRGVVPGAIAVTVFGVLLLPAALFVANTNSNQRVDAIRAAAGWNYNVDLSAAQAAALLTPAAQDNSTTLGSTVIRLNGELQRVVMYHVDGEYLLGTEDASGDIKQIAVNLDS